MTYESECRDLVYAFYAFIDDGEASAAAKLFTENAVQNVAGRQHVGRAAIAARLQEREADRSRRTRHVVANLRVRPDGETHAQATGTLLLFVLGRPTPVVPAALSALELRVGRNDGHWLIEEFSSRRLAEDPA